MISRPERQSRLWSLSQHHRWVWHVASQDKYNESCYEWKIRYLNKVREEKNLKKGWQRCQHCKHFMHPKKEHNYCKDWKGCQHCKKVVFHDSKDCYSIKSNTEKRSENGTLSTLEQTKYEEIVRILSTRSPKNSELSVVSEKLRSLYHIVFGLCDSSIPTAVSDPRTGKSVTIREWNVRNEHTSRFLALATFVGAIWPVMIIWQSCWTCSTGREKTLPRKAVAEQMFQPEASKNSCAKLQAPGPQILACHYHLVVIGLERAGSHSSFSSPCQ